MSNNYNQYDVIFVGSGMTTLTAATLLAQTGAKVLILESHDTHGGYAHSFKMGEYWFNAQIHYIFSCGEGDTINLFLKKVGLEKEIEFTRLDPEGYDRIEIPGHTFKIPNGWNKYKIRLQYHFPDQYHQIEKFFRITNRIYSTLRSLSHGARIQDSPKYLELLQYKSYTLQRLFNDCNLTQDVQAIIAGQAGDMGLPPKDLSLFIYLGLTQAYDIGAYYPKIHYKYFLDKIVEKYKEFGGEIKYESEVTKFEISNGSVKSVIDKNNNSYYATTFISNIDPKLAVNKLLGKDHFPARFLKELDYEYSFSGFMVYLGLKNINLKDYGFGSFNTWRYPSNNINNLYHRQEKNNDFSSPWIFISTATQHSNLPGIAPKGNEILQIATNTSYNYWKGLKDQDVKLYYKEKLALQNKLLNIIRENYIPDLNKHIDICFSGTPTTNERYVWAPKGNAYGSNLTPNNINLSKLNSKTPIPNLYFANATKGMPGIGGTVATGAGLYTTLTGDKL